MDLEGTSVPGWEHQRRTYAAVRAASEGLLLHLGMGTGKTLVAIAEASHHEKVLIVAPKSVIHVWKEQIEKFSTQNKRFTMLEGAIKRRIELATDYKDGFAVTNYDSFSTSDELHSVLMERNITLIVLDESHYTKSHKSNRTKRIWSLVKLLRKRGECKVLCLTGTPMTQDPLDMFTQLRMISDKPFGNSAFAFRNYYSSEGFIPHKRIWFTNCQGNRDKFHSIVSNWSVKIGREVLDLPEATHLTVIAEMNPEQKREHKSISQYLISQIKDVDIQNAAVSVMKLQQVANGFIIDSEKKVHHISDTKIRALEETVESIAENEPIVIFYRFQYDLEMIRRCMDVSVMADLQAWKGGSTNLIALQIQSGSVGIDLTRANYCIFYAIDYNLANYEQALARIHRPGQTKPVTYIHILSEGSVDKGIFDAVQRKKDFLESLLNGETI